MADLVKVKNALISVYHKEHLDGLVQILMANGVNLYSTGGTATYLQELGATVHAVEDLTKYPSIFGGRVKTLHPKVFGGILYRREDQSDVAVAQEFEIPPFDLVVVDLYPFEQYLTEGKPEADLIEKIDIGGISLIRAGAKNFNDVYIISHKDQYQVLTGLLSAQSGETSLAQRRLAAAGAFGVSSRYDSLIFGYFNQSAQLPQLRVAEVLSTPLRYGENPHQPASYFGDLQALVDKLSGKDLSYNNLLDLDAALRLLGDFDATQGATFAIIKHNNACGIATASTNAEAYELALAADPVSAFGGVLASNHTVDLATAQLIQPLFFEILVAPDFTPEAINLLTTGKKNRILLKQRQALSLGTQVRSALNGYLVQAPDTKVVAATDLSVVTKQAPSTIEMADMLFANTVVKHTKSNTIVLAKGNRLIASGTGQTSRIDALKQAIAKAQIFGFDLNGAVMASDAFFPFPDCVQIAYEAGIKAVIQPGGSVRDQESIDYCDSVGISMTISGIRHFKH